MRKKKWVILYIYGLAEVEEKNTLIEIKQSFTTDCEVEQIVQWQAGSNDCSDLQQCQFIKHKEYFGLRS